VTDNTPSFCIFRLFAEAVKDIPSPCSKLIVFSAEPSNVAIVVVPDFNVRLFST
jgi:hypothetical protein